MVYSSRSRAACLVLAVVAAVALHVVWYAFVNTATGQAIDRAAFEGALVHQTGLWEWGRRVLEIVSNSLIVVGAIAAVIIAVLRRRAWLAIQALTVIVGANVTTQLIKNWYPRPRLLTGWTGQNSLPSGHTTVVAAASVALLLTVPRRWRIPMAVAGSIWTLITGLSTLIGRWHRPADVVAALLVTCFWGALACLVGSARSLDPPPPNLPTSGQVSRVLSWAVAGFGGVAALSTALAGWSLLRLRPILASESELALLSELTEQGESVAFFGGVAALTASVFGVFGLLLWLRQLTLTRQPLPLDDDNRPFLRYGARLEPAEFATENRPNMILEGGK